MHVLRLLKIVYLCACFFLLFSILGEFRFGNRVAIRGGTHVDLQAAYHNNKIQRRRHSQYVSATPCNKSATKLKSNFVQLPVVQPRNSIKTNCLSHCTRITNHTAGSGPNKSYTCTHKYICVFIIGVLVVVLVV